MNVIEIEKKCVGCGVCVDICPVEALRLSHNRDGFYKPVFSNNACINCGKCQDVCPALNCATRDVAPLFYYGWSTDEKIRKRSSSGGLFSVIAEHIIRDGGVVIGAKYSDDFKSVVMSSTEECELDELRRSKYCQSFSNGIYQKISQLLKNEKKVMMVGTPCQIAAARRLFGDNPNLLLVDFLCGGVTPDTAFFDYIDYIEKKYRSRIVSVNMREKKFGWSKPAIRIEFENGKEYLSRYQFDYYYYYYYCTPFLKNEPCMTCSFTSHPDADITIADFWGYDAANVQKDEEGISLLCTYTKKGEETIQSVKSNLVLHPLDAKYTTYAFQEKKHSKEELDERELVLEKVRNSSFIEMAKSHRFKHGKIGILSKIMIRKVLRK